MLEKRIAVITEDKTGQSVLHFNSITVVLWLHFNYFDRVREHKSPTLLFKLGKSSVGYLETSALAKHCSIIPLRIEAQMVFT